MGGVLEITFSTETEKNTIWDRSGYGFGSLWPPFWAPLEAEGLPESSLVALLAVCVPHGKLEAQKEQPHFRGSIRGCPYNCPGGGQQEGQQATRR